MRKNSPSRAAGLLERRYLPVLAFLLGFTSTGPITLLTGWHLAPYRVTVIFAVPGVLAVAFPKRAWRLWAILFASRFLGDVITVVLNPVSLWPIALAVEVILFAPIMALLTLAGLLLRREAEPREPEG